MLLVHADLDVKNAVALYMDDITEIQRSVKSDMNKSRVMFIANDFNVAATMDQVREGHVENFAIMHLTDARNARNYLVRNSWNMTSANVEYMLHNGEVASMPMPTETCTLCIEEIKLSGPHRGVRICESEGCSSNHTICFKCATRIRSRNTCPWCQGVLTYF